MFNWFKKNKKAIKFSEFDDFTFVYEGDNKPEIIIYQGKKAIFAPQGTEALRLQEFNAKYKDKLDIEVPTL